LREEMVRTTPVVEVALRAVLMRADRLLRLRGACCCCVAVLVVLVDLLFITTSSITNTTKADAKPKRNKNTNTSTSTSILTLRRMAVVVLAVRMAVGVRVGSRRLRFWIARRASKMLAFIFADVSLQHLERAQMDD